jgi:hypothetical protein
MFASVRNVAKKYGAKLAVGGAAMLTAGLASATAIVDYSSAVTSATAEIGSSVTTALPLFGTVMAIGIGVRIVHKFSRG